MKKITILILPLLLFANCQKHKNEKIKIGVILPLTGDASIYGQAMKNGIMLAYDESSIKNRIELIFEDDQGQNTMAMNVAQLLFNKGVSVVIGGAQSKTADVVLPLFEKNKIPLISPGASSVDFDSVSNYFFRVWPSDSYDGKVMADVVYKQNLNDGIAIFYTNSRYGIGVKNVFEERIKAKNGKIVFSEGFAEGSKDFRTQILKIKRSGAKSVFIPGYFQEISIIIKQIREFRISINIYGTSSFHDDKLFDILGSSLEGIVFSYPDFNIDGDNQATLSFANKYFQKYKLKGDVFAANAYDCYKIIDLVINNGAKNSQEINNGLSKIKDYPGAGGVFSFDKFGSVIKSFSIYMIQNGKYVILKKNTR
jgi:branched-chain amino acid transport system substrate-binding protein